MTLRGALAKTIAGLTALIVLAGCTGPAANVNPVGPTQSTYGGVELTQPYTMPDATFTDSDGKPFNLRTGSDKSVLVIFFGYTSCPDICLTTMSDLASALNRVRPETRAKIQVLLISVDPKRDTPAALKAYLARFDPTFIGLNAPLEQVKKVAGAMGVAIEGTVDRPDGGYDVNHTTQVIGFDAQRKGRLVWTQGTAIGAFKADFDTFATTQP